MKNIELKIKVNDFRRTEKRLKRLGAKYCGALNQKDTYFNCAEGRLKIRETNNKNFELIFGIFYLHFMMLIFRRIKNCGF